jgi:3-dehydroquinate synthase II
LIENKRQKKIILKPVLNSKAGPEQKSKPTAELIDRVKDDIDLLYIDDPFLDNLTLYLNKDKIKLMSSSEKAEYRILEDISDIDNSKLNGYNLGKKIGVYKKVNSNKDVEDIRNISERGANFVIIDVEDWKIIPLENIIAALQKTNTEIFAIAKSVDEVKTLFSVLELGVDGVVIETDSEDEITKIKEIVHISSFDIVPAKIVEIKDVGIGERVCIDTVSMLSQGEGMLVGNKSNFLFLVHNESIGSSFTSPRPFRVNAGAVHCYTITPDGTTKYLSEMESGSQIIIVDIKGKARNVSVGRSKIETRPLKLFKASYQDELGSIIVQNAETIRFIDKNGKILPVTHIKIGDEVMVYSKKPSGRHFGMEVSDEYIMER